jgi:thiol-disulfide isomerase/thioredoxin
MCFLIFTTTMTLEEFIELQKQNKSILLFFFTASWCGPCKKVKPYVFEKLKTCPYPCYCKSENVSFIPDKCVTGGLSSEIDYFFNVLNRI